MAAGQDRGASVRYLHSTMVLFKLKTTCTFWEELKAFTFHYGPIQICSALSSATLFNHLHSTMVLFKLFTFVIVTTCAIIFTFHYGPIQIIFETIIIHNVPIFTFHYGPIQICHYLTYFLYHFYLHSTMVLFKFYWQRNKYIID